MWDHFTCWLHISADYMQFAFFCFIIIQRRPTKKTTATTLNGSKMGYLLANSSASSRIAWNKMTTNGKQKNCIQVFENVVTPIGYCTELNRGWWITSISPGPLCVQHTAAGFSCSKAPLPLSNALWREIWTRIALQIAPHMRTRPYGLTLELVW